jgi:hypothetical protein
MTDYEFALRFRLPDPDMDAEGLLGSLQNAGCDDATVGTAQRGRIALDFTRTAPSAREAMDSALRDVQRAIPGVELLEATPDYVGVTDIADVIGVSRQRVLVEITCHRATFPRPVHEGRSALYHLAPVLLWFADARKRSIEPRLVEVARAAMCVNVERDYRSLAIAELRPGVREAPGQRA